MPAWIKTPEQEEAWKKAKSVVSKQRKKPESEFDSRDFGLVTHIAQNILSSGFAPRQHEASLIVALADVEHALARRKVRKSIDASMPSASQDLVAALSTMAAVSSETISALRKVRGSVDADNELADEIRATTNKLRALLSQVIK